jgi:hypothetical protein
MSVNLKNNPIWYKFENRSASRFIRLSGRELIDFCEEIKSKENLEIAASALVLEVKTQNETEYSTTLDPDYFQSHCNNDFKTLVNTFNISRTNPVKVTRQGMSLFPFCLLLIFPMS